MAGMLTLGSCIYDSELCPDNTSDSTGREQNSGINMRLTVAAPTAGKSRADHTNETEEKGTLPEEYIDLDQLQLMLFDAGQNFLQQLHPTAFIDNNNGTYDITLDVQDAYFDNNMTATSIRFYILALANHQSMGAPWLNAFQPGTVAPDGTIRTRGTNLSALMGQTQSTTMTVIPNTAKLIEAGQNAVAQPQYMPMSGIQTYSVTPAQLLASSTENPIELADLNLLRALAKIEVVDKVNYTGQFTSAIANNDDRIDKIELAGYVNKGNMLPLYSQWRQTPTSNTFTTAQLTAPCIPTSATFITPPAFDRDFKNIIGWDGTMRQQFARTGSRATDNAPVFSCYVYEFLNPATGAYGNVQQPPYLTITTKDNMIYPMRLATYNADGESSDDDYLTELVRNHIYRYEITAIEHFKANLTLEVMDWDLETITWEYTDNIGIADGGEIEWTEYGSINANNATVTFGQDLTPMQCTFALAQPLNATWRAVFVPIGDTPPEAFSFRFTNEDGETVEWPYDSGMIDGQKVTLTIVPNIPNPEYNFSARLQIIVTLPDGRSMNADICNGKYGSRRYFTINQNAQL